MKILLMYCGANPLIDLKTIKCRILVNKLANSFPTKTPDEWPTWRIRDAVYYNSGSSVLKLLELISISCATTPHTEQQYQK